MINPVRIVIFSKDKCYLNRTKQDKVLFFHMRMSLTYIYARIKSMIYLQLFENISCYIQIDVHFPINSVSEYLGWGVNIIHIIYRRIIIFNFIVIVTLP